MSARTPADLADDPDLAIISRLTVWDGRFPVELVRFRHRRFDGRMSEPRQWEVLHRGRAAAVLPYDPGRDSVLLIEQFRLPARLSGIPPILIETPAGLCDDGEQAEATARRELTEETGFTADRLEPIADVMLSPGAADERVAIYAGRVTLPAAGDPRWTRPTGLASEGEDIRLLCWPAEQAIAAAFDGSIRNGVTLVALLWFAARRDWLRQHWGVV